MPSPELDACPDCSGPLLDLGDELVCPKCGVVREKEVTEARAYGAACAPRIGSLALGSYMGKKESLRNQGFAKGLSGANRSYEWMKAVSDRAGRDGGAAADCDKMIERVAERLALPRVVTMEAESIARKVLETRQVKRRKTIAGVSAYSLTAACRIEGMTAVGVREVIQAHADLGRRVTSSAIIQLSLESPVRTFALGPEGYLQKVLAKLSMSARLQAVLEEEGVSLIPFLAALRAVAKDLLAGADYGALAGKRPCALAASAVYSAEAVISKRERRRRYFTQREIALCADASEYTVREQCGSIFTLGVEGLAARRTQTFPLRTYR